MRLSEFSSDEIIDSSLLYITSEILLENRIANINILTKLPFESQRDEIRWDSGRVCGP